MTSDPVKHILSQFGKRQMTTTQSLAERLEELSKKATPGPWPMDDTGDGKRIVIGEGLVEGPNGYEVAEVYSDDCPRNVAEANATLITELVNNLPTILSALRSRDSVESLIDAALENAEDVRADGDRSHDWLVGYRMALEGLRMALPLSSHAETAGGTWVSLETLNLIYRAMNHMGDVLNGMDAVTEEDDELATPAFDAIRAMIKAAKGGEK